MRHKARKLQSRPPRTRLTKGIVLMTVIGGSLLIVYELAKWHHGRQIEQRMQQVAPLMAKHARANQLDEPLVRAVVRCESGGDPRAVSSANAKGLMQITPITEREVLGQMRLARGGDLFDPDYNLSIGCRYLRQILDRFDGDVRLALAAYNMGPTRLDELRRTHRDLAPQELIDRYAPAETIDYVRRVRETMGR